MTPKEKAAHGNRTEPAWNYSHIYLFIYTGDLRRKI